MNSGEVYRIISKPWHNQEVVTTVAQAADASRLRRENERLTIQVQQQNDKLRELNLRLEERVRERTEALLGGLIAALDYRDAETQWHSRRVSLYARRLALQLGVAEPDLTIIEHGALLHDIGKIGIRDRVLLKPGPLDASEWKEMKRHPELGWELLRRVEYLQAAPRSSCSQHQEKWDGTGYPAGLKGEDILIGARMFHVVDAYDAITSDRPYRKARGYAEARSEITRCRGASSTPRWSTPSSTSPRRSGAASASTWSSTPSSPPRWPSARPGRRPGSSPSPRPDAAMATSCHGCGAVLDLDGPIGRRSACPQCDADLHCCINCRFYDESAPHECREPHADHYVDKIASNACDLFQLGDGASRRRAARRRRRATGWARSSARPRSRWRTRATRSRRCSGRSRAIRRGRTLAATQSRYGASPSSTGSTSSSGTW